MQYTSLHSLISYSETAYKQVVVRGQEASSVSPSGQW